MADIFELMLSLDLRDEWSEDELAELRFHLGLGPRPEILRIATGVAFRDEGDYGELDVDDPPQPLLGRHGGAFKVGGALVSVLLRRAETGRGAWALTSRQEIHPDQFDPVGELLGWLATKAGDCHRRFDGSVALGWTRFCESDRTEPLVVRDGVVMWPS
ncbi:hypothetical protein [Streptomyces sp. NPDC007369]|uniref:hypothetical protein n=1 Tax=Streptomyces sp. NPDC007369 TaxID=3154589 RepID=UPI0033F6187B